MIRSISTSGTGCGEDGDVQGRGTNRWMYGAGDVPSWCTVIHSIRESAAIEFLGISTAPERAIVAKVSSPALTPMST